MDIRICAAVVCPPTCVRVPVGMPVDPRPVLLIILPLPFVDRAGVVNIPPRPVLSITGPLYYKGLY